MSSVCLTQEHCPEEDEGPEFGLRRNKLVSGARRSRSQEAVYPKRVRMSVDEPPARAREARRGSRGSTALNDTLDSTSSSYSKSVAAHIRKDSIAIGIDKMNGFPFRQKSRLSFMTVALQEKAKVDMTNDKTAPQTGSLPERPSTPDGSCTSEGHLMVEVDIEQDSDQQSSPSLPLSDGLSSPALSDSTEKDLPQASPSAAEISEAPRLYECLSDEEIEGNYLHNVPTHRRRHGVVNCPSPISSDGVDSSQTSPELTMPPRHNSDELTLDADNQMEPEIKPHSDSEIRPPLKIVWRNVFQFLLLNVAGVYSVALIPSAKFNTLLWGVFLYHVCMLGVTAGTHRLWSHRSFKAKIPLRILLAILQSAAFQNSIYEWCRDHRVHHKASETNGDPHNAKRGFFFSHIGWLMVKKHPDVIAKGKQLDLSDLENDGVVMFQKRHYFPCVLLFWLAIPTLVPWYYWGESLYNSLYLCVFLRYCATMHSTWLVNSAAHLWGMRPYDKHINPSENKVVSLLTLGEGFHNYHHSFPHDYSTSELPWSLNLTTIFIDTCAYLGLAHGRRKMSEEAVLNKRLRTGDLVKQIN